MFARRAKTAVLTLSLIYASLVGGVALFYRALLYPAPKSGIEPKLSGAQLVTIDGGAPPLPGDPKPGPVFALYAKAPPGAPTLVHFHGNGEELVDQVTLARQLMDLRVGVLAVEYPGYGLAAKQTASEESLYAAAERALGYLRDENVTRDSIVLIGFSLGTGVAAEMARRGHANRLVLIAPYTSIVDMVGRYVPIVPTSLLVGDRFDTLSKASSLTLPALVIHGDADPVVPVEMGRRVASTLPNASLDIVPGGHHADLFVRDSALAARIVAFARGGSIAP